MSASASESAWRAQRSCSRAIGQLQARLTGVEERLDDETQPPVRGHFLEVGDGHCAQRDAVDSTDLDDVLLAARGLDAAEDDLCPAGFRARVQPALAQRAENRQPFRIARGAEDGDGRLSPRNVVRREIGERGLEVGCSGVARRRSGEPRDHQRDEQSAHHAFFWYVPW
jgi:hypothetical protein